MTDSFTETEVIATVTRLTRLQLVSFIEAEFVRPAETESGYIFHRVDIARLELLCDLSQDLDLDETALGIVISLIDQLHAARHKTAALARAITDLPAEHRAQIMAAMNTK